MHLISITTRYPSAGTLSDSLIILRTRSPAESCRAFLLNAMQLDYDKLDGLVPAVVQDTHSREVLMVGFMNEAALRRTLETGYATFYSRTRNKLWTKGETSGHRLAVHEVLVDCDNDTLVLVAEQTGPGTCHLGYRSCFFRRLWQAGVPGDHPTIFQERAFDPGPGAS